MELHEQLYALGWQLGREVFEDPDSFRGALDDFMDEGAASTGDINLLVDAVRLGAYRRMLTMLDSGAQPGAAVEAAGDLLSRERGSADVAGSRWACAVLGYAVGKVSAVEVQRYRTSRVDSPMRPPSGAVPPAAPTASAPPGMSPPAQFGDPGQTSRAGQPGFGQPGQQPPPAHPGSYPPGPPQPQAVPGRGPVSAGSPFGPQQPPEGASPYYAPPPQNKRKTWPIVVAAAVALAVIAGIAIWFATKDSGSDETSPPPVTDTSGTTGTTGSTDPADHSTDLASVDERYQALGSQVTTAITSCATADLTGGQTDRLTCDLADGTLELATYDSEGDMVAARNQIVNYEVGNRYSEQSSGVFFSQQPDTGDAVLYWDDQGAFQSGLYTANPHVKVERLETLFKSAGPASITFPSTPENAQLITFFDNFANHRRCERTATLDPGETEESSCTSGTISVYNGHLHDLPSFQVERQEWVSIGRSYGSHAVQWYYTGAENKKVGTKIEWVNDNKKAVIFWDDHACRCYALAFAADDNLDKLHNWWAGN